MERESLTWLERLEVQAPGKGLDVARRILYPVPVRVWHRLRCGLFGIRNYDGMVAEVLADLTRVRTVGQLERDLQWWRHRLGKSRWMVPSVRRSTDAFERTISGDNGG